MEIFENQRSARRISPCTFFIICFLIFTNVAFAQLSFDNAPDVDITTQREVAASFILPIESYNGFSGTYGELRGDHFHCGLDLRTAGVTGKRVYAADDGYVSRITISSSGFGNMIQITHPSGYKTIYGHLLKFAPKYQEYVRRKQYSEESWNQEIDFEPGEFPVRRGDLIAYSGNTGSSGGPHLHFEVRDPDGVPVNLQMCDVFGLKDTKPPVFRGVKFYGCLPFLDTYYSYPIDVKTPTKTIKVKKGDKYVTQRVPDENAIITVDLPKNSFVAIDAYDAMEGTAAKLAVYEYSVELDTTLIFKFTEGNIPTSKGRSIASMMVHSQRINNGRYYLRTLTDPGNTLSDRITCSNKGLIVLDDTLSHTLKLTVTDIYGNKSSKKYKVRRRDTKYADKIPSAMGGDFMGWANSNKIERSGLDVTIPAGALFASACVTTDSASTRFTPYSPLWQIGDPDIVLASSCTVTMRADVPENLQHKVFIAKLSKKKKLSYAGGSYDPLTRSVTGSISSFGDYCVAVDTVPPVITFKFSDGARLVPPQSEEGRLVGATARVEIKDELSGIKNFRAEIDGHWVVAEFDGKTSTLIIPLADAKIDKGHHILEVRVTDRVENQRVESRSFVW